MYGVTIITIMSDYRYPDEFISKTKARIQSQIDGNGVDPKTVELTVKRQGVGTLTATTTFTFDIKVETRTEKGRQTIGRVIPSGSTKEEIQKYMASLSSRDEMEEVAKSLIQKSPNQGFAMDKQILDIPSDQTVLCEHQNCGRCQGQGQAKCHTCQGQGRCQCNLCHGRGLMPCITCNTTGMVPDHNTGQQKVCHDCQGQREKYCTQCQGQRTMPCGSCNSTGQISCKDCGGHGAQSIITTIKPIIKTSSAVNLPDLESDPKNMVSKVGADVLAKGGHIDIKNVKPPIEEEEEERAYYEDEPEDQTKDKLYYETKIEWAVAEVNGEGSKRNIYLVGSKGAVANSDPFMKSIFEKPLSLIARAAKGDGYVAGLLKDACEYRVSRETLEMVTSGHQKKAMMTLHKKYNIGTTPDMFKSFVVNGFKALKKITQRPRYIGLTIGLILSAGFAYQWFIGGLRGNTAQHDELVRYALDLLPMLFSMGVSIGLIRGFGYFTLKSVMRDIGILHTKIPAMGKAGIYAIIGNILIWGLGLTSLLTNLY